eukprot:COSAG02_NODE_12383_length_1555_cov_4.547390_2_plen_188_part_01
MFLAVITPLLLHLVRMMVKVLFRRFACCKPSGSISMDSERGMEMLEMSEMLLSDDSTSRGPHQHTNTRQQFKKIVGEQGLSLFEGVILALVRGVGWHLGQAASYFVVYGCSVGKHEISGLQITLGAFVVARESAYALMVFACAWFKPDIFLLDIVKNVKQEGRWRFRDGGGRFLAMYVLAPEKFIAYM